MSHRSVVGHWDCWPATNVVMHTGWTVKGCGCPWQATVFSAWEDAVTHALQCQNEAEVAA